ncbi:hypothetical protein [Hyphomicrobium sp.]|uniref:hypothetical protein n=1 Tax=Hyphomicrobium sp. TaxID=82 RepID=UPI0025C1650A|nr:hypothetical protein [Hyphomicrobium sp.]MCC7250505.1 hypothetical protein [Hyphomicrobium sp.]
MFLRWPRSFAIIFFAIFTFFESRISAVAAETCNYVPGTQANKEAPCEVASENLLKATTKRVAERLDEGTPPTAGEIAALKGLVRNAQRLLLRDQTGAFPRDRIIQQIESLVDAASAYPREQLGNQADATAVDEKIKDLIIKLFVWTTGSQSVSVTKYAAALNGYLTSPDAANAVALAFGNGLPAEFEDLVVTSLDKGKENATGTLEKAARALSGFIDKNKAVKTDNDVLILTLFGDGTGLVPRIEGIEEKSQRPAPLIVRRATALSKVLDTAIEAPNATEERKLEALAVRKAIARTDVTTKLAKLGDQIEKLTELPKPRIHIVQAWYGHLGRRQPATSRCFAEATNAIKTRCERQTSCAAEGRSGSALLDPIKLCGFDPAPTARGRARGLVVEYSCEKGDADFWAKLYSDPLVRPDDGAPYDETNTVRTVLRSSAMQLSCEFPVTQAVK